MAAKLEIGGSSAGAVKAVQDLNKALDAIETQAEGATKASKKLSDQAQRIKESIDPQTKYNRKIQELATLVTRAGLDTDVARQKAKQYGVELQRAGQSGDKAFGASAAANFASYVAGLGSITAVVGAITSAFQKAEAAAQAAADAIFDSLGAVGELAQLGPEGLNKALGIQRELIQTGTVKTTNRAQAAEIAANMVNAGLTKEETDLLVKDLGGAGGLVRAENLTTVGGNLKSLMTQFRETDMRDVTERVLVAANKTKADLAVTSSNILKFGELAVGAGISLEEAAAGYVASEKTAASPEAAAEMQKSFYSQVYRRGLSTGGLEGTLENIRGKIPKGGTAFDVLGDANAVIGYEAMMKDREGLRRDIAEISTPPEGMIRESGDLLGKTSPAYRAAQLKAKAEGEFSIVQEELDATRESLFDTYRTELATRGRQRGEWAITRWGREADLGLTDVAGNEAAAFRAEITQGQLTGQRISDELLKEMKDYLARIAKAAEQTVEETGTIKKQQRSKVTTRANDG
jgi:uncharacterized protein YoxC